MIISQLIFNGLIIGSIYALVACGFSLIYSTNRFMHLAHGSVITLTAYFFFLFFKSLELPFITSALLVLIIGCLFGYGMNKLVYSQLQKRRSSNIILLIASVGILTLTEAVIMLTFGVNIKSIGFTKLSQDINILGASLTIIQALIILTSITLLILLYILMNKTKAGRNIRAVSDNKELAEIIGIDSKKIITISFIVGSFLAGIAGIFVALEQSLQASMGTNLIIKGFTGAIIGGITSVPASILGSYLLGLVENLGIWFIPASYKDAIAFSLLFIFLLLKPNGLFGIDKGAKK